MSAELTVSPVSQRRQSIYYLLGAALQGAGALLVQPFSIRILDSTQWGRVGLAAVLLQVGQVILSAGLPLAITKAYFTPKTGPTHARAIHGANIILSLVLSLAAAGIYFLITPDRGAAATFALAIVATGLLSAVVSSQSVLRSQRKALAFVILSGAASLGCHLLGLAAISLIAANSETYLGAFAVGMLATGIAAMTLAPPLWPSKAWDEVKAAFRLGLPVLPHSLAIMLLMQGDTFLVQHFQDTATAGRYVSAAAFALGPFSVLAALNNVWTTRIFEASHDSGLKAVIRSVGNNSAAIAAALSVAGSSAAALGMFLLKGIDHDVVQLARVLPVVACGYALYLLTMSMAFAVNKTGAYTWVTPSVLLIGVAIAWLPAQSGTLWELGAVKALVFTLLGVAYYLVVSRLLPGTVPVRNFVLALLASTAAAAINLALPTTLDVGIVSIAVVAVAGGIVFWAVRKRGLASM